MRVHSSDPAVLFLVLFSTHPVCARRVYTSEIDLLDVRCMRMRSVKVLLDIVEQKKALFALLKDLHLRLEPFHALVHFWESICSCGLLCVLVAVPKHISEIDTSHECQNPHQD